MTLIFEEEGELRLDLPCEELATKVIEAALDYEECPYEVEVNLLLTMNDEIQEMNQNFRQIDKATDVLSFPMIAYEEPGNFDFLEDVIDAFPLVNKLKTQETYVLLENDLPDLFKE